MDGMEIVEALTFSLFMPCFFAVLMFSEETIIFLGIRLIRKMAEVLPEKDRERWINEQCGGWIEERKRKKK